MAKKVKSYKRADGTKVKAHVRKTTQKSRERAVGKRISRQLGALIGETQAKNRNRRSKGRPASLSKNLTNIIRAQKKKNARTQKMH